MMVMMMMMMMMMMMVDIMAWYIVEWAVCLCQWWRRWVCTTRRTDSRWDDLITRWDDLIRLLAGAHDVHIWRSLWQGEHCPLTKAPHELFQPALKHGTLITVTKCHTCNCLTSAHGTIYDISVHHYLHFTSLPAGSLLTRRLASPQSVLRPASRHVCLPWQPGHNIVAALLASMPCTAHSHLLYNSQHSLRPRFPYFWLLYHYLKYAIVIGPTCVTWYV